MHSIDLAICFFFWYFKRKSGIIGEDSIYMTLKFKLVITGLSNKKKEPLV